MKRFTIGLIVGALGAVLLLLLVGQIPTTGLEMVDKQQVVHRLPLWEKASHFYLRHRELERMAEAASGGETDPARRVLKIMEWTRSIIQPLPPDWPLIDDHVSYIVHRRHGKDYQVAEVFTTLTTYTGNPGRWWRATPLGGGPRIDLSFVQSEKGWWVFDVRHGTWFETPSGQIATVADFQHPEALHIHSSAPEVLNGVPYMDYFWDVEGVFKRSMSRAHGQMPWPRLLMLLGLEPNDGDWHPAGSADP